MSIVLIYCIKKDKEYWAKFKPYKCVTKIKSPQEEMQCLKCKKGKL